MTLPLPGPVDDPKVQAALDKIAQEFPVQGTPGAAATVTVGSTTTGAAGTSASVTNSGTTAAAVLEFTIPRGDTGATGPAGSAATVAAGTTTTGAAGSSASVTNSGTSSAAVFDFTIPRGDTGAAGTAATVAVGTTTTGAAGTSASVTNSGTSSAATLNFTIPKGDKGDTGATGPDGNPTGAIIAYAGSTAPTNYLLCDGSVVSQTTYAALYAVVSTTYNTGGEGAGNFRLPNLKGRTVVGRDSGDTDWDTLGETRGSKTHTLAESEIPSHTHGPGSYETNFQSVTNTTVTGAAGRLTTGTGVTRAVSGTSGATGGGGSHNNIQPSIVLNYLIRI